MKLLKHCLWAAHNVIVAVEQRLSGTSMNEVKSIRSSVGLILHLIAKLDTVKSSQDSSDAKQASEMKQDGLHKVREMLNEWLRQKSLMGSTFGGIHGEKLNTGNPKLELKVT